MPPLRHIRFAFVCASLLFASTLPAADSVASPDTVIPRLAAAADPEQQYSLYLPPGDPAKNGSPLLVILDARGRGESSLRLAVDAARSNGWVVISSWQSRSDANEIGTLRALQALLGEAFQRYRIDRGRIYLAGLSGTAKTLWTRADVLAPLLAGMLTWRTRSARHVRQRGPSRQRRRRGHLQGVLTMNCAPRSPSSDRRQRTSLLEWSVQETA